MIPRERIPGGPGVRGTIRDMITGIDHVQLCCPQGGEELARAFWGGVVGLVEVPKPTELAGRGGCWFRLGPDTGLHVGVLEPFTPQGKAHPALRLADRASLNALVANIEDAGHVVEWAEVPVAEARCKLRDPFGNLVELLVGTTG